jgi:hypothetical protein
VFGGNAATPVAVLTGGLVGVVVFAAGLLFVDAAAVDGGTPGTTETGAAGVVEVDVAG